MPQCPRDAQVREPINGASSRMEQEQEASQFPEGQEPNRQASQGDTWCHLISVPLSPDPLVTRFHLHPPPLYISTSCHSLSISSALVSAQLLSSSGAMVPNLFLSEVTLPALCPQLQSEASAPGGSSLAPQQLQRQANPD
jgi:hypothetical protein